MAYFLFAGDMFVMAFMMAVVVRVSLKSSKKSMQKAAEIPLNDEYHDA
jgi:cbb3-type cytochrome oxidase subunit 3